MSLRFTVPLPSRTLSPNSPDRHSWKKVGAARKDYRNLVRFEATSAANKAGWKRPERARVSIIAHTGPHPVLGIHDGAYRPRDHGNLVAAFKPGFDGLVDACVILDDDGKHMTIGDLAIASGDPCIDIIVEAIDGQE